MALENRSLTKTFYLTPSGGKLQLASKEKKEGYEERIVETSKGDRITKYVKEFDALSGLISDVSVEDSEYGKKWVVNIQDGSDTFILRFAYSSGYSETFLQQIENVDLSKPVYISPSYREIEKDGKIRKQTGLWLRQDNELVKFKYSKDNPQGRPDKTETTYKGKTVWDDTDRLRFHESAVAKLFNEFKLNNALKEVPEVKQPEVKQPTSFSTTKDVDITDFIDDDLPF